MSEMPEQIVELFFCSLIRSDLRGLHYIQILLDGFVDFKICYSEMQWCQKIFLPNLYLSSSGFYSWNCK